MLLTFPFCICISVLRTLIQIQNIAMPAPWRISKPTRASKYLGNRLEENNKPVLTHFDFARIVRAMYRKPADRKLYLRGETPDRADILRFKALLKSAGAIGNDRDYGSRIIRVLAIPDLPAEDIVCLVDPTCHVSHLSAMQRWGLTNRSPLALSVARPDRSTAVAALRSRMDEAMSGEEHNPFPLKLAQHPARVRRRNVIVHESKAAGAALAIPGTNARISTIGQTFLDMLQRPDLCGGMSHVLEVWNEHAGTYLDEIVSAVDRASKGLIKSRAGHILEERMRLRHDIVESWKALGQRGGSRKLDPAAGFAPTYSETWMISLNV